MFYPARMKNVTVLTHSNYIFRLTYELHRSGIMQIDPVDIEGLESSIWDGARIESLAVRAQRIMDVIRYEESRKIMDQIFHPEPPEIFEVPEWTENEIIEKTESVLSVIEEELAVYEDRLATLRDRKTHLEDLQAELLPLRAMEFDLRLLGKHDYTNIVAGVTRELEGLEKALDSEYIHIFHAGTKGDYSVVIVAYHTEIPKVEKAKRQRLFDTIDIANIEGTPKEGLRDMETELLAINGEIKEIEEEMRSLYKTHREDLLVLSEELEVLMERSAIYDNYGITETTTSLTGWIENGHEEEFETLCKEATDHHVEILFQDPQGEEPPTKLKNPSWARPFEGLIHMFSTPRYNELDSTTIVGPLFIIFFGLMVGDAGYGLILLLLAIFVYRKHAKFSMEIKDYAYFILLLGISTFISGLIMGGFFYDSVQRFVYGDQDLSLYPHLSILGVRIPMDPMKDPSTIFLLSIFIGLITLNIGILLSTYHHIQSKNYLDLVTDDLSWFILQPGGIMLIGAKLLGALELSSGMTILAALLTIVGLLLRIVHSKGLVMFDLTGFVGNVLSFARILALALATAGLALAINFFTELVGGIHPVLIILGLLLFVVAHFGNTLLQSLGGGIHSLRLQYVEFFSMFYEGGGRAYKPFHASRKWTKVIEKEVYQ